MYNLTLKMDYLIVFLINSSTNTIEGQKFAKWLKNVATNSLNP